MLRTDERNITSTVSTIINSLNGEYEQNIYTHDAYLPGTFMFAKRFIFLTNFVSENVDNIQTNRNSEVSLFETLKDRVSIQFKIVS